MEMNRPLKLFPTRTWRTYTGGKLLDELHGIYDTSDGHFPEEWIMSVVSARNTGREQYRHEGLSFLDSSDITLKELIETNGTELLGKRHVIKNGMQTGVLVKLIDSAERLTIQVHPDKEMSGRLFQSAFGKTECWHILGGREINGENPCIYMGFKPGITCEEWKRIFQKQDIPRMLDCLHRFEVKEGDTFLIHGGIPHAIGAGCLLVEIQEPTDYSIRTERVTPAGYQVSDFMCHQGLGFEQMFECFHYTGYDKEETYKKWHIDLRMTCKSSGFKEYELVGYRETPCFRMVKLEIRRNYELHTDGTFSGLYMLSGNGTFSANNVKYNAEQGDQFFIPAAVDRCMIENCGDRPINAIRCFGPSC
ncbi:MAG: class I mannose-6-phosphate isomerase [Clostridiaceae bacterium]